MDILFESTHSFDRAGPKISVIWPSVLDWFPDRKNLGSLLQFHVELSRELVGRVGSRVTCFPRWSLTPEMTYQTTKTLWNSFVIPSLCDVGDFSPVLFSSSYLIYQLLFHRDSEQGFGSLPFFSRKFTTPKGNHEIVSSSSDFTIVVIHQLSRNIKRQLKRTSSAVLKLSSLYRWIRTWKLFCGELFSSENPNSRAFQAKSRNFRAQIKAHVFSAESGFFRVCACRDFSTLIMIVRKASSILKASAGFTKTGS